MIGSSFDFDMKGEDRIRLLNELMQLAQQINTWIITLGLNVGLARFVGDAKAACDAKNVALIGMCPWGMVEGRQALG